MSNKGDKSIRLNFLKPLLNDDEGYELVQDPETFRGESTIMQIVHVDSVGKRTPLVEIYDAGGYLETEELV